MRPYLPVRLRQATLFQSTHPLRDATKVDYMLFVMMIFQSTHPLRDATIRVNDFVLAKDISIHAPLTGCDPMQRHLFQQQSDFNPRTPYGMRRHENLTHEWVRLFQSTHPLRDATYIYPELIDIFINFNPRTPYGMRLFIFTVIYIFVIISIHAPLTGCDF